MSKHRRRYAKLLTIEHWPSFCDYASRYNARAMSSPLDLPSDGHIRELIRLAVAEDLGEEGDVTSRLTIPEDRIGVATIIQRAPGVACGLPMVEMICRAFDERIRVEWIPGFHLELIEGRFNDTRLQPLVRLRGPLRSLLGAERTLLNFLSRLSGVATLTRRFVRRVDGTGARIYDTRKTLPGFRALEKYAVRCGGGNNHRFGLYDVVMIKDNHLAGVAPADLGAWLAELVRQSRKEAPERQIIVEVDGAEQFRQVVGIEGVDVVLLDNMDCPTMARCVRLRRERGGGLAGGGHQRLPELEASGGVTLETVRDIAQTGVDRIAVGAITHSAPGLDIALDVERG